MADYRSDGRIIGIDYGQRRIGVAVTDELGITAQSLPTIIVQNTADAMKHIGILIKEYHPVRLVLGLPRNMSGEVGASGRVVQEFGNQLFEEFHIPVDYFDERLTSKQAERVIREFNKKPSRNKEHIDSLSAVIILQGYLAVYEEGIKRNLMGK
jgi:putative Holliday junction resolvase